MTSGPRFGILLGIVLIAVTVLTWDEFKFVMGCVIKEDTAYLNEDAVDIIDQQIKVGVALSSVREIFEKQIPGGEFYQTKCDQQKLNDGVECGANTYTGNYPFGIHDCICGRPSRIFTLIFSDAGTLTSLNYIDRKSCT